MCDPDTTVLCDEDLGKLQQCILTMVSCFLWSKQSASQQSDEMLNLNLTVRLSCVCTRETFFLLLLENLKDKWGTSCFPQSDSCLVKKNKHLKMSSLQSDPEGVSCVLCACATSLLYATRVPTRMTCPQSIHQYTYLPNVLKQTDKYDYPAVGQCLSFAK